MKNTKLFMFAACTLFLAACGKQTVKIMTPPDASNRVLFSAEQLQSTLDKAGYQVMMQQVRCFPHIRRLSPAPHRFFVKCHRPS